MKVDADVRGMPLQVLIDSGASYNFICCELVVALRWPYDEGARSLRVRLGDGHRIHTSGLCQGLRVDMGSAVFFVDAYLLDIASEDVILGMPWLKSIGEMMIDWRRQCMRFEYQGERVEIHGTRSSCPGGMSLQALIASEREEEEDLVATVEKLEHYQEEELQQLLREFEPIFQEPKGLPPKRTSEHRIDLLLGTGPINVRPYRYPHHLKDEIERQVKELLGQGVIRHSNNPYSSPVLLVKKKDQTWRMCVDYRALNKATIPDKFPIPVIEELLDELQGAKYFSKLDLKSRYHQVRVRAEDVSKTAFRTHEGHFEFLVMPFGLMNAPSTFQALMNGTFRKFLRKFVLVFFDDILVYSPTWAEHTKHLDMVLQVMKEQQLSVNRKKMSVWEKESGVLRSCDFYGWCGCG